MLRQVKKSEEKQRKNRTKVRNLTKTSESRNADV